MRHFEMQNTISFRTLSDHNVNEFYLKKLKQKKTHRVSLSNLKFRQIAFDKKQLYLRSISLITFAKYDKQAGIPSYLVTIDYL